MSAPNTALAANRAPERAPENGAPGNRVLESHAKSAMAFRTISEVARAIDVPAHVLRFWESRFPQITPVKRGGGRRYYRPEDVRLLCHIRELLYDNGYTIKGVQKLLHQPSELEDQKPRAKPGAPEKAPEKAKAPISAVSAKRSAKQPEEPLAKKESPAKQSDLFAVTDIVSIGKTPPPNAMPPDATRAKLIDAIAELDTVKQILQRALKP